MHENSIQSHSCLVGISVIFLLLYCLHDKANKGGKKAGESYISPFLLFLPFTDQNPFMQLPGWGSECAGLRRNENELHPEVGGRGKGEKG